MSRIIAIASGKGGAGKTSVAVNLAFALARLGRRVCILDADLGLSNVDILLGITPGLTLENVLFEGLPMERAVTPVGQGVDVVAGSSGVSRMAELSRPHRLRLAKEFAKLSAYHYLLVDNSPGISSQVVSLCLACSELLMVVNPEPSSMTDAYALIKVLKENGLCRSPGLLLNRVASEAQAVDIHARMKTACARHLRLGCRYLGAIPRDETVGAAAARQRPLLEWSPAAPAARAFLALAAALERDDMAVTGTSGQPGDFFERSVVRLLEGSIRSPGTGARIETAAGDDAGTSRPAQMANPAAAGHVHTALALTDTLDALALQPEARDIIVQLRGTLASAHMALSPVAPPRAVGTSPSELPGLHLPAETVSSLPPRSALPNAAASTTRPTVSPSTQGTVRHTNTPPVHSTIRHTDISTSATVPAPPPPSPTALRVSIFSSSQAMGDILEESLASAGMAVTRLAANQSRPSAERHVQSVVSEQSESSVQPQVLVVQLDGHTAGASLTGLADITRLNGLADSHHMIPLVLVDGFGRFSRATGIPFGKTGELAANPQHLPGNGALSGSMPGRMTEVVSAPFRVEALVAAVRRCAPQPTPTVPKGTSASNLDRCLSHAGPARTGTLSQKP